MNCLQKWLLEFQPSTWIIAEKNLIQMSGSRLKTVTNPIRDHLQVHDITFNVLSRLPHGQNNNEHTMQLKWRQKNSSIVIPVLSTLKVRTLLPRSGIAVVTGSFSVTLREGMFLENLINLSERRWGLLLQARKILSQD